MLLIFLIIFSRVNATINLNGPTVINDYVSCIDNLMKENFVKPGLLIFANSYNISTKVVKIRNNLLKLIHQGMKYVVQISSPEKDSFICEENQLFDISLSHMDQYEAIPLADYYVIIVENYKDFCQFASKIMKSRHWNPSAKFIISLIRFENIVRENENLVETILSCLFQYYVINVVVIVPETKQPRNSIIYGWRPYNPPKYCGYLNETAKDRLNVENICERGILKYKKYLFDDTIPSNMHECVLNIIAMERNPLVSKNEDDPNIEKYLVQSLLQRLNVSSHYKYTNLFRGERNQSGTWDGALQKLVSKQGQILLGGIFPDFDVHEDFECSLSYLADSYTWVVPLASPSPPWIALTIIFQNIVWYTATTIIIVCVFIWKTLGYLSCDSLYNKTLDHCFLNTWISVLGFCSYTRPKKVSLRIFFVFFNLYCILFLTAYQTKLIEVLQNPTFDAQIDSVEELVLSGLKFGGFEQLHDLFINSSDPFDNLIGEQWVDVDNMTKAMIDVVVHKNFSVLCSRLELDHISAVTSELNDGFGKRTYFVFKQNMFTVPLEMIALRGFPLMKKMSYFLSYHKQLGINDGLRRRFATYNTRKRTKLLLSLNKTQDKLTSLSTEHLQGGFLALLLGASCGSLALIIEILLNSKTIQNRIRK